jgi:hypothetical protein
MWLLHFQCCQTFVLIFFFFFSFCHLEVSDACDGGADVSRVRNRSLRGGCDLGCYMVRPSSSGHPPPPPSPPSLPPLPASTLENDAPPHTHTAQMPPASVTAATYMKATPTGTTTTPVYRAIVCYFVMPHTRCRRFQSVPCMKY